MTELLINDQNSIHKQIEEQVIKTPDNIAVVYQEQSLTYRELNERANQLSHYLRKRGVVPEVLVGVCLQRTLEMVIALLAILKAGGAYVPLDPNYPQERLAFILEDTQSPVILSQETFQTLLSLQEEQKFIDIYKEGDRIEEESIDNPSHLTREDNLAYLIYTSGSTGKPKAVCIEHRNATALIEWAKDLFTGQQLEGVLASTSLCFDLSIFEIFVTLACGGKVILADNALELLNLPARNQVTLINTVPSAIDTLIKLEAIPNSVTTVNLAGEALSNKTVQELYKLNHIEKVFNLYGPSEDTTYSTVALMEKGATETPSIGKPISGTTVYILDEQLQPISEGEIYISGAGVARGYLNRPELTREKFIDNPFEPRTKLYKTGDLAGYYPDGSLKYLGRIDHQVKIRGFRIELGEIETILSQYPGVDRVAVIAHDQTLIAYATGTEQVSDDWQEFLEKRLPHFMIPSVLVRLESFPLTLNGKLDRKALPIPQLGDNISKEYFPPQSIVEKKIAEIWRELLKVNNISLNDSFWELGGNSLLVIEMLEKIKESFLLEVLLESFIKAPSIAGLAALLEGKKTRASAKLNLHSEVTLDPSIYPQSSPRTEINNIFLTGATGMLGTHLLHELLEETDADIYCLVRSDSSQGAKSKIINNLVRYTNWLDKWQSRLVMVKGDLAEPFLGIEAETFSDLARKIDIIYHCGAWVNIIYPYSMLKNTNIRGTQEIIRLACLDHAKPLHFISTTDIFPDDTAIVNDTGDIAVENLFDNGYVQSKYIAEKIVNVAHSRGLPVTIYRPSNIVCLGQKTVYTSDSFAFIPRMLKTCLKMGAAPKVDACINLIPVDYVSFLIVNLSLQADSAGQTFNIVNPESLNWSEVVRMLDEYGIYLKFIPYDNWYEQLKIYNNTPLSPVLPFLNNPHFLRHSLGTLDIKKEKVIEKLNYNCTVITVTNHIAKNTYAIYFKKFSEFITCRPEDG